MPHLRQTLFAVVVAALLSLTGCAGYRPPLHHTGVPAFLAERVEVDGSRWEFLKSLRRRMDRSAAQAHTIIQSEDGFTALLPWTGDPTGGPEALTGGVAVIFFSGAFAPADQPTSALVCTGTWRRTAVTLQGDRALADQLFALEELCAVMAKNGY